MSKERRCSRCGSVALVGITLPGIGIVWDCLTCRSIKRNLELLEKKDHLNTRFGKGAER